MESIAETELFLGTVILDIRIFDFFSAAKKVSAIDYKKYENYDIHFYATAFPNDDDDEEEWLSARVRVRFSSPRGKLEAFGFKWAISLIDIEGTPRYTQYFENPPIPFGNDVDSKYITFSQIAYRYSKLNKFTKFKYLEKSLILKKADEFISDGSLLLRCDIYCDFEKIKPLLYSEEGVLERTGFSEKDFVPKTRYIARNYEPYFFRVIDFTLKILTLPQFDEIRKRFGVYGEPPVSEPNAVAFKEFTANILEDVWMFDTFSERFLLSLFPMNCNLGHLLVNASPVIKLCVETTMKEQREKRVVFPDVGGDTFYIVLHFLRSGEILNSSFKWMVGAYKFSHMYLMGNLQQEISQGITRYYKTEIYLRQIEEMAELYSDEYLLGLMQSRWMEICPFSDVYSQEAKPNSDSFI